MGACGQVSLQPECGTACTGERFDVSAGAEIDFSACEQEDWIFEPVGVRDVTPARDSRCSSGGQEISERAGEGCRSALLVGESLNQAKALIPSLVFDKRFGDTGQNSVTRGSVCFVELAMETLSEQRMNCY